MGSEPSRMEQRWCNYAEKARVIAERLSDPSVRRIMNGIAETFENLAAREADATRLEAPRR